MRFNSAERSTIFSQFEICSATSAPIPSTARKAEPRADKIFSGVSKTWSNFRNRTGPIVGSMFSAMHASVEFMVSGIDAYAAQIPRTPDGAAPHTRTELFGIDLPRDRKK